MQTPVALILFNRPDKAERVMQAIASSKPAKLFLIADGPRIGHPEDAAKCAATRAAVERCINWDCEVIKNYSEVNLGCGRRPASGITWVFEQVEQAILMEDDCIPHPTFFSFCEALLEHYRDDERVVQVGGNLYYYGRPHGDASYFFSRHNVCVGAFATWRRAWQHFDLNVKHWPLLRDTPWLHYVTGHPGAVAHWRPLFDAAYAAQGNVSYWDYQWTFACWIQSGLSIVSNTGLITNIGHGPDGTHTLWSGDKFANLPMSEMRLPLKHPPCVVPDSTADLEYIEHAVAPPPPSIRRRLRGRLYRCFRSMPEGLQHWLKRSA